MCDVFTLFSVMCEALGCQMSDKCYPCLLASGDHSTKTGMLLRDTYQPLFSLLQENMKDLPESAKGNSPGSHSISYTLNNQKYKITIVNNRYSLKSNVHAFKTYLGTSNTMRVLFIFYMHFIRYVYFSIFYKMAVCCYPDKTLTSPRLQGSSVVCSPMVRWPTAGASTNLMASCRPGRWAAFYWSPRQTSR